MTNWTKEQWDAVTEKDCNLLVAAAAGAGKTAVLVERIIKKITDPVRPVDMDRLLVVTFTNAAAAEMRERIAAAIMKALEENPGSRNMQRQLTLLNKAPITTIHSFCLEVIRSNFQHIDMDPNFRIVDETEGVLMKLDVLNRLFEDLYEAEEQDPDFYHLLECYGGNRDDQALQDMVLNLYEFIQSSPWPDQWLEEMTESFHESEGMEKRDFGETTWGEVLLDTVGMELSGMRKIMADGIKILTTAGGLEKNLPVFREDLSRIDSLIKICQGESETKWDDLYREVHSWEYARLSSLGKDGDLKKHEEVKKIRNEMKDRMKRIREQLCTADSRGIWQDLKTLYPLMACLTRLVSEFSVRYRAKKSGKSLVDFNDLEHFCLEILTRREEGGAMAPSAPALAYRDRFAEILVDEYQDSNLVQEYIIRMISRADAGDPNVFMVGDVKQSIYRFRQAKPELFLDKYVRYSPEKGRPFRKIQLYKNFRSRREVVDGINFLFRQIMSVPVGELDYTTDESLNPGAVFAGCEENDPVLVGGAVEFHLLETGDQTESSAGAEPDGPEEEEESGEAEEMPDRIRWEARLVAKRIRDLMRPDEEGRVFHIWDQGAGEYRPAAYRDVAILLRATRKWADIFGEELANQGIHSFADTGTGFFKSPEIQVIISLLQVIDNPVQDIPLLAVLRSPVVSLDMDELAELRLADRKGSVYDALQVFAANPDHRGAKKAGAFLHQLHKWRDMSRHLSTDRLIWQLYQETGYFSLVGAWPAGEQRQANLRILFERARQFEATSYKGLFNFIHFVDKLKSSQGDMGSAKILGANSNVVRIMSIHKSKGLEFPVVILSGCGKKFNLQDLYRKILLHQDLGFGPEVVDPRLRLSYPSAPKLAIREKIKRETLSEEMRILYVALTRAREKLIITGTVTDMTKALAKWTGWAAGAGNQLPPYEMLKGNRYLDWISPALIRHEDGRALRERDSSGGGGESSLVEDDSAWQIRLWTKRDFMGAKPEGEREENPFIQWLDSLAGKGAGPYFEEISQRLSWQYRYQKVSQVPAKVSVTELKRWFGGDLAEGAPFPEYPVTLVKKPLFLQEKKGLSGAEAGTVMHFVMQHLDYSRDDILGQMAEMLAKDLLTQEQAAGVDQEKIRKFFRSPLGKRLLAAEAVHREVPFFMEIPCQELYPDLAEGACHGEKVILQGVVDCYFEELDGLVLVDYKTDYFPEGGEERLRDRYRVQIAYYARALEMLTGKRVKEKFIYLFHTGEVLVYE